MSRTTQYIGLTKRALEYVNDAVEAKPYNMTEGMFGEIIHGSIYTMPNGEILTEVVQAEPWSSGPMIFTHLRCRPPELPFPESQHSGVQPEDANAEFPLFYFSWVLDPTVEGEVDYENGRYYV